MTDDELALEPIADGYAEPDYWMRCADGYARVCSALGLVRADGSPGDVDAVLSYLALLQQRAARVHELETRIADAWDQGMAAGLDVAQDIYWMRDGLATNPYREKP